MHIVPAVHPTAHPSRRVPLAIQDELKTELERMESYTKGHKAHSMGVLTARKAKWQTTGLPCPKRLK